MDNVESISSKYVFKEEAFAKALQLTIYLNELPQPLVDSNSMGGYYRDQIQFVAIGPGELDNANAVITIIIRFDINPGYDDAVKTLLSYETSIFFREDNVNNFLARLISRNNYKFSKKEAQYIVNRLMLNSSFTP